MKLSVKTLTETIQLQVEPSETICSVKKKIQAWQEKCGNAKDQQKSLHMDGDSLEDDRTLSSYNIPDASTLYDNDSVFENIFVKGLSGKTMTFNSVPLDSTAFDLKKKVEEKSGVPVDEIRLIYAGKQLFDDEKTLKEYNLCSDANLYMVLRLKGGGRDEKGGLILTSATCVLCECSDEKDSRVIMPCSCEHAFCGPCIVLFLKSKIEFDYKKKGNGDITSGTYILNCSYCKVQWAWPVVREVILRLGGLSPEEFTQLEDLYNQRLMYLGMGVKECPKCKTLCYPKDPQNPRVNCQVCRQLNKGKTLPDFCWHCEHEWKGRSSSSDCQSPCGNLDCTGHDFRLDVIKHCPLINIEDLKDTPNTRLCPKCGFIIEHKEACVHINNCPSCSTPFCFGCLREKKDGAWTCRISGSNCPGAPRQESIPVLPR